MLNLRGTRDNRTDLEKDIQELYAERGISSENPAPTDENKGLLSVKVTTPEVETSTVQGKQERKRGKSAETPLERKEAHKLCAGILLLTYAIPGVLMGIGSMVMTFSETLTNIILELASICPCIAIVLLIAVRIKYPKNFFGKVLMWVFIAHALFGIVAMCMLLWTCGEIMGSCGG